MQKEKKDNLGRKSKYWTHVEPRLLEVRYWAQNGISEKDIAKNLGIAESSFYEYKLKHLEFSEALRESKLVANIKVINALYKRATGFYTEEIEEKLIGNEVVEKKVKKKYVPPETDAAKYWLNNRMSEEWKDKSEQVVDVETQSNKVEKVQIEIIRGNVDDTEN